MFGLSVFITVLLVVMIWFRSFQRNLYALMNPPEEVDKMLAAENTPVPSLFGYIWQTTGEVKGLVSELFNNQPPVTNNQRGERVKVESGKVYTLPLSEHK